MQGSIMRISFNNLVCLRFIWWVNKIDIIIIYFFLIKSLLLHAASFLIGSISRWELSYSSFSHFFYFFPSISFPLLFMPFYYSYLLIYSLFPTFFCPFLYLFLLIFVLFPCLLILVLGLDIHYLCSIFCFPVYCWIPRTSISLID